MMGRKEQGIANSTTCPDFSEFTIYNFRRVTNIFGYKEFIKRLEKLHLLVYPQRHHRVVNSVEYFFQSHYQPMNI